MQTRLLHRQTMTANPSTLGYYSLKYNIDWVIRLPQQSVQTLEIQPIGVNGLYGSHMCWCFNEASIGYGFEDIFLQQII